MGQGVANDCICDEQSQFSDGSSTLDHWGACVCDEQSQFLVISIIVSDNCFRRFAASLQSKANLIAGRDGPVSSIQRYHIGSGLKTAFSSTVLKTRGLAGDQVCDWRVAPRRLSTAHDVTPRLGTAGVLRPSRLGSRFPPPARSVGQTRN
jgi:hypothetical protein